MTSPQELSYGPGPDQYAELWLPTSDGPHPVVTLVHGGFWRDQYRLDLMTPLAKQLVTDGYAAWNVEYRRGGLAGGGWPATLEDVAVATDHLANVAVDEDLDLTRVAVVGHSAGGQLALWIGQRQQFHPDSLGGSPVIVPRVVIGLAPVADLIDAAAMEIGDGAVVDFIGGSPSDRPEAYAHASPAELLPIDVDQVIIHGRSDDVVPPELTVRYQRRVGATDRLGVGYFDDTDHMDVIDPTHRSWSAVHAELQHRFRREM